MRTKTAAIVTFVSILTAAALFFVLSPGAGDRNSGLADPGDLMSPHEEVVGYVNVFGTGGYLHSVGVDTSDVASLVGIVHKGTDLLSRRTALHLARRREAAAVPAVQRRYRAAVGAGGRVGRVARDYLFALYVLDATEAEVLAESVADSLAAAGAVDSAEYEGALQVLFARGSTSQVEALAAAARQTGCCLDELAKVALVDTSLYPQVEAAVIGALVRGEISTSLALSTLSGALNPRQVPPERQPTPAFRAALVDLLEVSGRHRDRLYALVRLASRDRPRGEYSGTRVVEELERLLTDPGGLPEDQRTTLELAVEISQDETVRFVRRAGEGEFGPGVQDLAKDVLRESGLDALPTCGGRDATVYIAPGNRIIGGALDGEPYAGELRGTTGPDVIVGTDGPDTLVGLQGDDVLCGLGGDDVLRGSAGADALYGGSGRDEVRGDNGADYLSGGDGDDTLLAGADDDEADGGPGDDELRGAAGDDRLTGGDGADRLFGNAGRDDLSGGPGDDVMEGGTDDDVLRGGAGTDEASGGAGTDACAAEVERSCETDPDDAPDDE